MNTKNAFEYHIQNIAKNHTCFRLLYIEYSNYSVGSFDNGNGVLVYDLTQKDQDSKEDVPPRRKRFQAYRPPRIY